MIVLALGAAVVLGRLPDALGHDSWLTFLAGREIAEHGLPRQDSLTLVAQGREWVDQAWLAQLVLFGLVELGGLKLALLVHAAALVGAAAVAVRTALSLGAAPLPTAAVAAVALVLLPLSQVVRAQTFALLLFSLLVSILCREAVRPSRRAFLAIGLLILWANVHGSALIGAAVVGAYGLTEAAHRLARSDRGLRSLGRPAALAALAPLALLASPYALSLGAYYERFLTRTALFAELGGEWARPTLAEHPLVFATALTGVALVFRAWPRLTPFDRVLFLLVTLAALAAARNIAWLALAGTAILPRALPQAAARPAGGTPLRLVAVGAAGLLVVASAAAAVRRPASDYRAEFPPTVAAAVAELVQRDPSRTVFAHWAYADWLMFEEPTLVGRVASDIRFELLSDDELRAVWRFHRHEGAAWRSVAAGHEILVLGRRRPDVELALLRERGTRPVVDAAGVSVFLRDRR